jgi:hypothetical protein
MAEASSLSKRRDGFGGKKHVDISGIHFVRISIRVRPLVEQSCNLGDVLLAYCFAQSFEIRGGWFRSYGMGAVRSGRCIIWFSK